MHARACLAKSIVITFAIAVVLALGLPRIAYCQSNPSGSAADLQQAIAAAIAKVEPSVVAIVRMPAAGGDADGFADPLLLRDLNHRRALLTGRDSARYQPTGAGVVVQQGGEDVGSLILTQYLNVRLGERHTVITTSGQTVAAVIRGADPRSGLAVLELETAAVPALTVGDADKLRKGHFVATVGNPQAIVSDGQPSASWGIVANLAQRATPTTNLNNTTDESGQSYATTLHHLGTLLQTDAKLNWTSGGGAVVNLQGELIGITTTAGTLPGHESPAGYAIPMTATFRRVLEDLKAGREVEYGLLGLNLAPPSRRPPLDDPSPGAMVSQTFPGSAAHRAGLKANDRIVEVEGQPIIDATDIQRLVGGLQPGQTIEVAFVRNEARLETPVTLSKYYVRGRQVVTTGQRQWRGITVDYPTAIPASELLTAGRSGLLDPDGCVVVRSVVPGSSSANAGVQPGMFISHVGETRVSTPDKFYAATANASDTVDLRFTDSSASPELGEGI